jgi:hypothetical protein
MTPTEGKYWRLWRDVCGVRGWKSGDSSIRHAMHRAALGEYKSHLLFTHADWDRVFPQLQLLLDPDNLDAALAVVNYINHDAAQATHQPVVTPGKPRRKTYELRARPSRYERITEVDDAGERRRLCYVVSRLFEPRLIDHVCRDRWDRSDWQDLPLPQLTELRDLLKTRLSKFITKVKQGKINYEFGFSIVNKDTYREFLSNADIITRLLQRGAPVRMSPEPAGPTLMERLRQRRRHHALVGGPIHPSHPF